MSELIKNFGLGLLVNGIFAIMNGDLSLKVLLINAIAVTTMYVGILAGKIEKES